MTAFFASSNVQTALVASTIVAALSAVIGYFVVLRGLSFAGHAVTDIGLTGGAGALLAGFDPLIGLIVFAIGAASVIAALGARARERDLATGLVVSLALGFGALFLHLQTRYANAQSALLFGSLFDTDPALLRVVAVLGALVFGALVIVFRPLVFASVAPDAARLAGVPVRALGFGFLILMAIGVAETAQVVGVLISTALVIGPAATAMAWAQSPVVCIGLAILVAILEVWSAIGLAYSSYYWSHGHSWPVSFFLAFVALVVFVIARVTGKKRLTS